MAVKAGHLRALLDALMERERRSRSKTEFQTVSEKLGLASNYLYTCFLATQKAGPVQSVPSRRSNLDIIAIYLGYSDYSHFELLLDHPVPSQMYSCVGQYYSYVRRNIAGATATVYRSPARIYLDVARPMMELKGKRLAYGGALQLRKGCLFASLDSEMDKQFHHVYRIGESLSPKVLQGMFSGVSNSFEPIAGRAVLVRVDKDDDALENTELKVSDLKGSSELLERRLGQYFEKYDDNNLALNRVYTFGADDLGDCA